MKLIPMNELKKRLVEITNLSSILGLLEWDQNVYLPAKASEARARQVAELSSLIHSKFVALDDDGLLTGLKVQLAKNKLKGGDAVVVAETWRDFERAKKLPDAFVREMAEVSSRSETNWVEARKKNDFALFLPWLEKIVKLKRQEAKYIGYDKSPYDALIDAFEPGMTADEASKILNDLKDFLVPFVAKIKKAKQKIDAKRLIGNFPIEKQMAFNEQVVSKIGFDLEAGRIDKTVHPFEMSMHPTDVRITTRYRENDALYSVGSIIHEAGHGLYDQGMNPEYFGTPLSEMISHGIHESQSRLWENIIGKSESFWKYFYPKLQKEFPKPFKTVSLADFVRIINKVSPSLIRTEADEVTYNLHIIMRFEIEKEMIEGSIDLKDLPKIWQAKMQEYFGIKVPNNSMGVLQDVHWGAGLIGYFPTYTFGNLYSAQFYSAIKRDIPNIDKQIASGKFGEIREWLRKNIHTHGKTYKAGELVKKVTGEDLNSKYFVDYLREKYSKLYPLKDA